LPSKSSSASSMGYANMTLAPNHKYTSFVFGTLAFANNVSFNSKKLSNSSASSSLLFKNLTVSNVFEMSGIFSRRPAARRCVFTSMNWRGLKVERAREVKNWKAMYNALFACLRALAVAHLFALACTALSGSLRGLCVDLPPKFFGGEVSVLRISHTFSSDKCVYVHTRSSGPSMKTAEASRRSLKFMTINLHARKHDMQGSKVRVRDGGVDQGTILGRLRGDERSDPEPSVRRYWVQRAQTMFNSSVADDR
ncbi:hypothetical protein KCU61_g666, partial [Aureobasidium melanogenum]